MTRFTVGFVSILVVTVLLYSMLLSDVWAQKDYIDCAGEARAMRYEVYDVQSKCTRECGDAYYYDKEGRASCWQGCDAMRDAKLEQADTWLDDCLASARLRDARKDQSPQPTKDALPEETATDDVSESEPVPGKPGFGGIQETFQWLGDIVEEISTTLPLAFIGTTMMFSTSEAAWEEAQLMLESFGLSPSLLSTQGESPALINLNEKPPEYIVEVAIDPVVVKSGPALIEIESYNGEPGILRNGNTPMLEQGAVDVFIEPGSSEGFQIQTPDADFFVVLTKFSIIHSKKNSKTLLAVYEGEVEVKTKDGQTVRISPDGDKPGILVVGRKLSIPKLAIVAIITLAVISGTLLIARRKLSLKGSSKKKK